MDLFSAAFGYTRSMLTGTPACIDPQRLLAEQAFSRTAGAPLVAGNAVELVIDARAAFDRWLAAIATAQERILFANYIFRDDDIGRSFVTALAERARAGVKVCVTRDWLGCLGQSSAHFWQPLLAAGGQVRAYNPPNWLSPFGWFSRDHRKLLLVDREIGFVSGVCVSAAWLGDPQRGVPPWRDTTVAIRGPALDDLAQAFAEVWARMGPPLRASKDEAPPTMPVAGTVDLRVVATLPNMAGLYRLDQLIAAVARKNLWLADAYFVGITPYVQALRAAARDGVDVRLLVPGTSDIPSIGAISRAGYRPLLEAGVRVFEWNGSMMHAKTAVADSRWARVGSTNLNLASWIGNCEIDVAIENQAFAEQMQDQYERDLANATEIVLGGMRRRRPRVEGEAAGGPQGGSSGRAAASALRLAHSLGAAISNQRKLGAAESTPLLLGAGVVFALSLIAFLWPHLFAWPLGLLGVWCALAMLARTRQLRAQRRRGAIPPTRSDTQA